mmetsp:Transcript_63482/g.185615  ORF Transcript_63482/g.185615 Transcript_63482/m.185615 type:complete len:219 (+) Transcript_63482:129-785(+)
MVPRFARKINVASGGTLRRSVVWSTSVSSQKRKSPMRTCGIAGQPFLSASPVPPSPEPSPPPKLFPHKFRTRKLGHCVTRPIASLRPSWQSVTLSDSNIWHLGMRRPMRHIDCRCTYRSRGTFSKSAAASKAVSWQSVKSIARRFGDMGWAAIGESRLCRASSRPCRASLRNTAASSFGAFFSKMATSAGLSAHCRNRTHRKANTVSCKECLKPPRRE